MHGHVQLLRLGWQLRRWRARIRAVVLQPRHRLHGLRLSRLLARHRLLRLSPTCSVPAAVPAIAAVPAPASALAATTITSALSNKAAIIATINSDDTRIAGQVSYDDRRTTSTSGTISTAPTPAISVTTRAFAAAAAAAALASSASATVSIAAAPLLSATHATAAVPISSAT